MRGQGAAAERHRLGARRDRHLRAEDRPSARTAADSAGGGGGAGPTSCPSAPPRRSGGPRAGGLAASAATWEASATASKTALTQLRALDRFTAQRSLPSGTIDETLAKAWLAGCVTRAPNTRAARYYLLRRFCRL